MIRRILAVVQAQSFNRGLTLGALVGAAIAGSTLWSRLRGSRSAADPGRGDGTSRSTSPSEPHPGA